MGSGLLTEGSGFWMATGYSRFRWTPHPIRVTTRDDGDDLRVLLHSHYPLLQGGTLNPKLKQALPPKV